MRGFALGNLHVTSHSLLVGQMFDSRLTPLSWEQFVCHGSGVFNPCVPKRRFNPRIVFPSTMQLVVLPGKNHLFFFKLFDALFVEVFRRFSLHFFFHYHRINLLPPVLHFSLECMVNISNSYEIIPTSSVKKKKKKLKLRIISTITIKWIITL